MGTFLIDMGATIMCIHGGQTTITTSNTRVRVGGQFATTVNDIFIIAGCPFTIPPPKPQPCMKVQWLVPSTRIRINGQPALLQTSTGITQSAEQIPQGAPNVVVTQMRVRGM